MTSIVGVLCSDGVVIGADSAATFGTTQFRTIEQTTEKIDVIGNEVILAGTGFIGLGQRFRDVVQKQWDAGFFSKRRAIELVKGLSAGGINDFKETAAPKGLYGAIIGFACNKEPYLCEFEIEHFQPEIKEKRLWYESMGSAKVITDPFLALMRKAFWREGPPLVADAIFAVNWALQHAIEVNPGGVNGPIRIGVLEKVKDRFAARLLSEDESLEHSQNIEAAYEALRGFRERQQKQAPDVPDVPDAPAP